VSKFWDVLYAVKDRLSAVAGCTVVVRKKALLLEGDALPLVIVSPGTESVDKEAMNGLIVYEYGVNVTLIQAGNRVFETDLKDWLQLRETVRNTVYTSTLPGSPISLAGFAIVPGAVVEVVSGSASNYDIAGLQLTYLSPETRAS